MSPRNRDLRSLPLPRPRWLCPEGGGRRTGGATGPTSSGDQQADSTHMMPSSWISVSMVIRPHCELGCAALALARQRDTSASMVARLQAPVTTRDSSPSAAKAAAKALDRKSVV